MKIKIFAAAALAASLSMTSCNDDFLEKIPKTDLTEATAFLEYDNFKAFMYPCYALFTIQIYAPISTTASYSRSIMATSMEVLSQTVTTP